MGDEEGVTGSRSVNDPDLGDYSFEAAQVAPTFEAGPLKNLALIDELESISPATDALVADLALEGTSQVFTTCGQGPRSSLRIRIAQPGGEESLNVAAAAAICLHASGAAR